MKKHVSVILLIVSISVISIYQNCSPVQFSKVLDEAAKCNGDATCLSHIDNVGEKISSASQDVTIRAPLDKVDILLVDDNSGSMTPDQINLSARFANFVASLAPLDWQIAVTTTDMTNGGAHGRFIAPTGTNPAFGSNYIITSMTTDPSGTFGKTVQRTESGDGDERAIVAASAVVDGRDSSAMGFFRPNSNFAVIILSDEDERSVGGLLPDNGQYKPIESIDRPQTFVNKVKQVWGDTKPLIVNAIVIPPGDTACLNAQKSNVNGIGNGFYGTYYAELARLTGGVTGSICDNGNGAYTEMVKNIGGAIQAQAKNIQLDHVPVSKPTVTFDPVGNTVPFTWTAGSGVINLSSVPATGTKLHITYTYLD